MKAISRHDATVLQYFRNLKEAASAAAARKVLGPYVNGRLVTDIVRRLHQKGALERIGLGEYKAVPGIEFKVSLHSFARSLIDTNVPEEIREAIRKKSHCASRRQLARELGINKVVLNQILIEEGMDDSSEGEEETA